VYARIERTLGMTSGVIEAMIGESADRQVEVLRRQAIDILRRASYAELVNFLGLGEPDAGIERPAEPRTEIEMLRDDIQELREQVREIGGLGGEGRTRSPRSRTPPGGGA
jgi:hypothetical protein